MNPEAIQAVEDQRTKLRDAFRGLEVPNQDLDRATKYSVDKETTKARIAGQAWVHANSRPGDEIPASHLSQAYIGGAPTSTATIQQPLESVVKDWDAIRDHQSKVRFGTEGPVTDKDFYTSVAAQYNREDGVREDAIKTNRAAANAAIMADFTEDESGDIKYASWATKYEAFEEERPWVVSYPGKETDKVLRQVWKNSFESHSVTSLEAKKVGLALLSNLEVQEGLDPTDPTTQTDASADTEIFDKLRLMPKEERQKVYTFLQANVDAGKIKKDFSTGMGKALWGTLGDMAQDFGISDVRSKITQIDWHQKAMGKGHLSLTAPLEYDDSPIDILRKVYSPGQGRGFPMPLEPLPPEDLKRIEEAQKEAKTVTDIELELRKLRRGTVNPIKTDNVFLEKAWYPAVQQVGILALSATAVGQIPLFVYMRETRHQQMLERGMTEEQASKASLISSLIEAPLERLQFKTLVGGKYGLALNAAQGSMKAKLGVYGGNLASQIVLQSVQEGLQDMTPLLVQEYLGTALGEQFPELQWLNKDNPDGTTSQGELSKWGFGRIDTLWALAPMIVLGAGVGSAKDFAGASKYLASKESLEAFGLDSEAASEIAILAQTDVEAASKAFQEAEKGKPDVKAFEEQSARAEALANSPDRLTSTQLDDGRIEITLGEGLTTIVNSEVEGEQLKQKVVNGRAKAAREGVGALIKSFEDKGTARFIIEDHARTLLRGIEEGTLTVEQARQRIRDYNAESGEMWDENAFSRFTISAQNEAEFRDGVFHNVVRAYKGDNPLAIVEDVSEGLFKKRIALEPGARLKHEGWLDQYQNATGDILVPDIKAATNESLGEAFSSLATSYFAGKVQESSLPAPVKSLFRQLAAYFQHVFTRAAKLSKAFKDNKLDPAFEVELAESVGLSIEGRERMAIEQEMTKVLKTEMADLRKQFAEASKMQTLEDKQTTFSISPITATNQLFIKDYTGDSYYETNKFLRLGKLDKNSTMSASARETRAAVRSEMMEQELDKLPDVPGTYHRYVDKGEFEFLSSFQEGNHVTIPNFFSTTSKEDAFSGDNKILVEGLTAKSVSEYSQQQTYGVDSEFEFIFQPNTTFVISKGEQGITLTELSPLAYDRVPLAFLGNTPPVEFLEPVAALGGTFDPHLMVDGKGDKWVVKKSSSVEHTVSEARANKLYAQAGVPVPNMTMQALDNEIVLVSEYIEGPTLGEWKKTATPEEIQEVRDKISFDAPIDAVLGNQDVIGKDEANIIIAKGNVPYRVDVGGALAFTSDGSKKSKNDWSEDATKDVLALPEKNSEWISPIDSEDLMEANGRFGSLPDPMLRVRFRNALYEADQREIWNDTTTFSITPDTLEDSLSQFFRPPDVRMEVVESMFERLTKVQDRFRKLKRNAGTNKTLVTRVETQEVLAQLEAIVAALPLPIRGKITGFATLASKSTDVGRLTYLEGRIERSMEVLDKHLADESRKKFDKLLKRSLPKAVNGKLKSYLTAEVAEDLAEIKRVSEMTTENLDAWSTGMQERVMDEGSSHKLWLADRFGAVKAMDAFQADEALTNLRELVAEGRNLHRITEEAFKNDIANKISQAVDDSVKDLSADPDPEDVDRAKKAEKEGVERVVRGIKGFLVDHLSFRQSLITVFGYSKTTDRMEKLANDAKNEYTDATLGRREAMDKWMESDLLLDTRKERFQWLVDLKEQKETGIENANKKAMQLSQDEAVYYTMLWDQPHYRSNLEKHDGIDRPTIDKIEAWLTPESKQYRAWLQEGYDKEYDRINAVYRVINGVDLPRVLDYSPASVKLPGAKDLQLDPLGQDHLTSGLAAGFTKLRTAHELPMRRVGASTVYWAHAQAADYYVSHALAAREIRLVLSNPKMVDAIVEKHGVNRATTIQGWVTALHNNGLRQAALVLSAERWTNRLVKTTALVGLSMNIMTLAKQSSAGMAMLAEVTVPEFLRGMTRYFTEPAYYSHIFKSKTIQRRIANGFSPEMQAAMQAVDFRPDALSAMMEKGVATIGLVDALWTTFSAGIAFDAAQRSAKEAGLTDAQAEDFALKRMDILVARTAQPASMVDRSLMEVNMDANILGRLLILFKSEMRQKSAITMMGVRDVIRNDGRRTAGARAALAMWVGMPIVTAIFEDIYKTIARDDEDEDLFTPKRLGQVMTAGQSAGIFFFGEALEAANTKAWGGDYWDKDGNTAVRSVIQAFKSLEQTKDGSFGDDLVENTNKVARAVSMILGGRAAALGVGARVVNEAVRTAENISNGIEFFPEPTRTQTAVTDLVKEQEEQDKMKDEAEEILEEAKPQSLKDADAAIEKTREKYKDLLKLRVGTLKKPGSRAKGVKAVLDAAPDNERESLRQALKDAKIVSKTVEKHLKKLQ